jgi:hypothetical protein
VSDPGASPRDRRVFLVIAVLVVAILIINVVSALVPGMDGALASMPIVVAILVGGTVIVLGGALLRRR